ncbi:MAG: hypothetical protein HY746_03445, partial [Elusimicrobia bacterium]|nr:hypothetical protein [Elusimicrobiota bacterium]
MLPGLTLENVKQIEAPAQGLEIPVAVEIKQKPEDQQTQNNLLLAKILAEADGGFVSPVRQMSLEGNSELLFDPYASFSRRYQILSGEPFDKNVYDKLNQGSAVDFNTCPENYPNAPQFKEIFIIMWVIVDDYTGRTLECLIRHHLNKGARARILIGEFFMTDFLKKKLGELNKIPLFEYKTIAGDFTGWFSNKNIAPHYKSMVAIGQDPKDSAIIAGGRNLSDRYYFNNRPNLHDYLNIGQRPEGNNAGAGIFNDFDIYIKDHATALNGLNISRLLWNRLSNNFTFDLRLPLEDQLKILYNSREYDFLKEPPAGHDQEHTSGIGAPPPRKPDNPWLDRVHEDMGILKDLSVTEHENRSAYHYEGLKLIPGLHSIVHEDLLMKYSEKDLEAEIINTPKPPNDIKSLEKKEVNPSNSKLANFRIELYKKFENLVDSSGLFKKVSKALEGSYYKPKFREWYNDLYKIIDKMLFKRELFTKVKDLYHLFFKPEHGNPKEVLTSKLSIEDVIVSQKEFEPIKESVQNNNEQYRDLAYGVSADTLKQLLNDPAFSYQEQISVRDYIYGKYYAKNRNNTDGTQPFFRYFASVPGQGNLKMEKMFVDLINASKKSIKLANCFFNPTPAIMTALKHAALRGVQVYITLNVSFQGDDDVGIPEQANARAINEVVKLENFNLYRWDGTILHAKIYAFDDEALFIGSTNMNTRTFYYNGENGVFIYDKEFTEKYIKTIYDTHFVNTGKHPMPGIKVSKIEKLVKEKG